jgi:hypothetical protein
VTSRFPCSLQRLGSGSGEAPQKPCSLLHQKA